MNWDAINAIAEAIAAIAVILTLIYLAKEVRHNTRSAEIAALRDTTAQWNQWSDMLATSPDLADIVARGNVSMKDLSEPEQLRYGAFVQSFFDNAESYRSLVVDHSVQKDFEILEAVVARRLAIPGFREWWSANQSDYSEEYGSWIRKLLDLDTRVTAHRTEGSA